MAYGTTIVTSSTFTGNGTENDGGAIDNYFSQVSVEVKDSIFMGDGAVGTGPEFQNTVTSLGNNVVSEIDGSTGWVSSDQTGTKAQPLNALLGTPGNFGGPTQTIPLLPGSPALGVGVLADYSGTSTPITTDQRGEPLDLPDPDIGAFQSQGFIFTPVAGSTPQDTTVDDAFPNPLAVTVSTNVPSQVLVGVVVTFKVDPASGGASASLSASSATTGTNGVAQVSAVANNTIGSYTVVASAGEGVTTDFSLQNSNGLIFSGIADKSITYGTSSVTVSGSLAEAAGADGGKPGHQAQRRHAHGDDRLRRRLRHHVHQYRRPHCGRLAVHSQLYLWGRRHLCADQHDEHSDGYPGSAHRKRRRYRRPVRGQPLPGNRLCRRSQRGRRIQP